MFRQPLWRIPLFLLLLVVPASAFAPPSTIQGVHQTRQPQSTHTKTSTTSLNVVFTRLSEDCLQALSVAQEQAKISERKQIDASYMLLGLCEHPGNAASTFQKYNIQWQTVRRTLNYLQDTPGGTIKTLTLADFKDTSADVQLPYSTYLQERLFDAGRISQQMGADEIDAEHVFLALLNYEEIDGETYAATRGDDCEAMELLYHIDATLEGEDICQDLLLALMDAKKNPKQDTNNNDTTQKTTKAGNKDNNVLAPTGGGATAAADNTNMTLLEQYGTDLTQMAKDGELDVVHGRDEEIQACMRILLRRRKNNVCLIGEAGTGKTSIAEALAQRFVSGENCPVQLKGYKMVSLETSAMVAGTKYRGAFEERLRGIIQEIVDGSSSRTILFLDEMHTLMGSGATDGGGTDAANLLKPYLARGQLKVVAATTITEYNRFIAKDPAMDRRFQPVLIKEPSVEQTVQILEALLPFYRGHHRVEFEPNSLEAAARLSDRYIADRFLPDKAIDLLDEAGALATLRRVPNEPAPVVDEALIMEIVSTWSTIPVGALEMDETEKLERLEESMAERVKGQERAVTAVARAIRRARTGVRDPRRPISSFLFAGPTGTGKTELCKTLAETYFGSERSMIRIDMSEYGEKFTVSRLTGPPPGFIGYEEGGQLTEAVRRAPHSVILLDELEKAHPDVLNVLLQVMDDGILTDGKGRTVSFKNTIIIMTSNIGSRKVLQLTKQEGKENNGIAPDGDGRPKYAKLSNVVQAELESFMKPEFLNRIDDVVIFQPLTENELAEIASRMAFDIAVRTKLDRNINVVVQPKLLIQMVKEGSKAAAQFGARPMRRAVQRILEDAISTAVMKNFVTSGGTASFDLEGEVPEECNVDELVTYTVAISRDQDDEVLRVEMEESCRDMVSDVFADDENDAEPSSKASDDELLTKPNGAHPVPVTE
ncbi:protein ClpB [Seminavis robusta]|uniref:Protein ClpB n=1 Tax=Seminavis robusta TaxID=568900 RepID=A0A9N8D954_9STRA|nr:protein ClpB [Seminavis robusta]|eukprot:Sro20_g014290.1 protein ClpB (940) ;mRNA; r:131755-135004